jgi:hypothetical protein
MKLTYRKGSFNTFQHRRCLIIKLIDGGFQPGKCLVEKQPPPSQKKTKTNKQMAYDYPSSELLPTMDDNFRIGKGHYCRLQQESIDDDVELTLRRRVQVQKKYDKHVFCPTM